MWLQIGDRVQLLFWPHSLGEVHFWTKQINITNYYKSYCRNCWCCLCCHLSCNYNCRKPDGTCWTNEEVIIIRVFLCFFWSVLLWLIHPSLHLAFSGGKIWGLSLDKSSFYHMGCLSAFKAELTFFHMDLIPLHYILWSAQLLTLIIVLLHY